MTTDTELTNVISGEEFRAGSVGNVAIVYWKTKPTEQAVARVETIFDRVLTGSRSKGAYFVVVDKDASPPDTDARNAFAASMRKHSANIFASYLVIEGSGIRAAAMRAVTTAISLIGDVNPMPQVCATVEGAAETLEKFATSEGTSAPSVTAIVAACNTLRAS